MQTYLQGIFQINAEKFERWCGKARDLNMSLFLENKSDIDFQIVYRQTIISLVDEQKTQLDSYLL